MQCLKQFLGIDAINFSKRKSFNGIDANNLPKEKLSKQEYCSKVGQSAIQKH